ncbi:MAG TPA: carbon storage regulator CsrA [Sedimentisphaerales bacterium]|nr:carbon storage regulator CsrA [Sedimentisphaerales bacterium]
MLVLSRHKDESIMIGDNVEVIIVDVQGNKVRLGINAPKDISVHRKEVYRTLQREKNYKESSTQEENLRESGFQAWKQHSEERS